MEGFEESVLAEVFEHETKHARFSSLKQTRMKVSGGGEEESWFVAHLGVQIEGLLDDGFLGDSSESDVPARREQGRDVRSPSSFFILFTGTYQIDVL